MKHVTQEPDSIFHIKKTGVSHKAPHLSVMHHRVGNRGMSAELCRILPRGDPPALHYNMLHLSFCATVRK